MAYFPSFALDKRGQSMINLAIITTVPGQYAQYAQYAYGTNGAATM